MFKNQNAPGYCFLAALTIVIIIAFTDGARAAIAIFFYEHFFIVLVLMVIFNVALAFILPLGARIIEPDAKVKVFGVWKDSDHPTRNASDYLHSIACYFVIFLVTGALVGGSTEDNMFNDILAALAFLPYALVLYVGTLFFLAFTFLYIPAIAAGVIGLMSEHPATPTVKRHAARRRPSAVVTQELSQALKRHAVPDEHLSALLAELPSWSRWWWAVKARTYAEQSRGLKDVAEAERSAQEADTDLAYTVAQVERDRRARHPDYKTLTPERIRALAEQMIADDIKAKAKMLTPEDLDYHAKLREAAEE